MATPTNDSYSVASGQALNAGRFASSGLPTWRSAMSANTWAAVSSATMDSIDPEDNAALNPNGAGNSAPWRGSNGQAAIIDAWGSACWDEANRVLWVPNGGGHTNYGGNEPYKIPLGVNSPAWSMVRPPSGAIGNTINLDDGNESSGVYSDGRVRSTHAYGNIVYAPGVGPVIARLGSVFLNSGGNSKVYVVNPTTGEPDEVFNFADATSVGFGGGFPGGTGIGNYYGACCYDSLRNRIVSIGTGSNTYPVYCTPDLSSSWSGGHLTNTVYLSESYLGLVYLPVQDRIMAIVPGSSLQVFLVHPTNGGDTTVSLSGSFAAGFSQATQPGAVWCPELGKVLLWNNTSGTTVISTLTPDGDGLSAWTRGALTVSGGNSVTPPTRADNGTFGLFGYSAALRGCYLITSTSAPVHFYATE